MLVNSTIINPGTPSGSLIFIVNASLSSTLYKKKYICTSWEFYIQGYPEFFHWPSCSLSPSGWHIFCFPSRPILHPALFLSRLVCISCINRFPCPWASGWIQLMESKSGQLEGGREKSEVGVVCSIGSLLSGVPHICRDSQWKVSFPVRR